MVAQQFSGINTAMYYGPELLKQTGFFNPHNKQLVKYIKIFFIIFNKKFFSFKLRKIF